MVVPDTFYLRSDVVEVARDLIGTQLHTVIDGVHCSGIITETEAYCGATDRASHAFGPRRTDRTSTMFAEGGHAYVYLCYGLHYLFNIVTNAADLADAVLIRSIAPIVGVEVMMQRRNYFRLDERLCSGPARMSQALGIDKRHNGIGLQHAPIWLEFSEHKAAVSVVTSPRIGVAYAGIDALLPWRFTLKESKWISHPPKQ